MITVQSVRYSRITPLLRLGIWARDSRGRTLLERPGHAVAHEAKAMLLNPQLHVAYLAQWYETMLSALRGVAGCGIPADLVDVVMGYV